MVHLVLFFATVITTIKIKYKGNRNVALLLSFGILFLFAALRYDYGNDYWSYHNVYNAAQQGINSGVELLYYELNRWFPSFQIMIAILSLIYLYAVYMLISKFTNEKQTWMSVMIFLINPYIFLMSLSAIRQTIVCSIFILSIMIESKKQLTKLLISVVLMGVSFFIHKTAILLVPFYFLYYAKRNVSRDYLVFVVIPIALLLEPDAFFDVIDWVLQLFDNDANYVSYLESGASNSLRATLLSAIIYLYVLLNLKHLDEKIYPIAKLYLCGLVFALLAYRVSMMTRFQMYFDIFGVVALPAIININFKTHLTPMKQLLHRYLFPITIFVIFILRYYSFFTNDLWSSFVEYHTVLFK